MESSALQLRLLLTSIAFGITMSCTNQSNDTLDSTDSIANESRSGSLDDGLPNENSALNYRNGVNPNVELESSDSIELPDPILKAISGDSLLNRAEILKWNKREDNGITIFEVVFFPVNSKEEKVTFDAEGKRRQKP